MDKTIEGKAVVKEQDIHSLKVLPHRLLINYKRKTFPLQWSDPVGTPLTEWSNLASAERMEQNGKMNAMWRTHYLCDLAKRV